jgi:starvation-inducible outer membrane lipoprotein
MAACARVLVLGALVACSTIPRNYLKQVTPGVTLTDLKVHPDAYQGKVVILGGVIVEKREEGNRIWLLVKNRPLDEDYVPHIPASAEGSEAGHYWVLVSLQGLPATYRSWARLTVVGRVADQRAMASTSAATLKPVLQALYLRGWGSGVGEHAPAWEDVQDPNMILSAPGPVLKKE